MSETVRDDGLKTKEKTKAPNLGEFLESHRGEKHLAVLQDFPDPDAISSAMAYQLIADQYNIETTIVYSGRVSHQQNIAMVKLLGVVLRQFQPDFDFSPYTGAVFLDNQGTTSIEIVNGLKKADIPALVVIDHHEFQDLLHPEFQDIRRVGATATIFTQYFERGPVKLNKDRKDNVLVATALMQGIMTDTGKFVHAQDEDFLAAGYLSTFRDVDLLGQVLSQSRSKQVMEVIHKALTQRVVAESYSIAGIGYLRAEDRDVIPQAADFLLTEENVHTVIVYGIVTREDDEERVVGSMRTSKITLDPDEFIKEVLGKDAYGHYFGGGKITAAGFEIPVGFLSGGGADHYREMKWQVYDNQIKQKLFAKIGVGRQLHEA